MADPDSSSSVQHPDSVGQLVRIHSGVKALRTIINCQRNKNNNVRETIPSEKFYQNQCAILYVLIRFYIISTVVLAMKNQDCILRKYKYISWNMNDYCMIILLLGQSTMQYT